MQVNFQQFPGQGEAAFRIYRKRHGMTQVRNTVGYTENINFRCLEDLQEAGMARVSNFLTLDYCGYEKCAPGYSFGPYVRENFVLHIIFAGKGFLEREDKTYSVRAGQAFIIRPGAQALYRADRDDPWTYRWVGFHGPLCSKIVRNMGFSENEDVITLTDTERFAEYIDAMLDNKELNYSNHLRRNACLNLLLADIIDQAKVPEQYNKQSEEIYVDMAVEMIMANFSRNVSVAWIASEIGINRSYLSIIFKKRTGMSPQQYLISCRLERAAALLLETDMSIRAISASVGYSDPLTFSKAFKQNFGASPSIYRDNPPGLSHRAEKGEYEGKRKL